MEDRRVYSEIVILSIFDASSSDDILWETVTFVSNNVRGGVLEIELTDYSKSKE